MLGPLGRVGWLTMSAQVIDSQVLKSTSRRTRDSGSVITMKPIGGVVEMCKCGAPRCWNSFFQGPISSSPHARRYRLASAAKCSVTHSAVGATVSQSPGYVRVTMAGRRPLRSVSVDVVERQPGQ